MKRLVLIGGGQEGLETLAHAVHQARTTVALIVDPDPAALVFRLESYGYELGDGARVPLAHTLDAIRDVNAVDLAVDATSVRSIRRAIAHIAPGVDVIGSASARYLWGLADTPPAERAAHSLKRFKPIADQVDLSTPRELAYVMSESARLVAGADTVRVSRWDDARQRLIPLGAWGGPSGVSPLGVRAARERRVIAVETGDPAAAWCLEDAGAAAALVAPITSEDEVLGVVELWRASGGGPFPPEIAGWLTDFGHSGVRAFKKLSTLREVRELAQAEATRRDLKGLLAGDGPIRHHLQRGVETLAAILQASAVHVYVRAPQTGDILLQASTSLRLEQAGSARIPWGVGLVGEVAKFNRAAVLREDLEETPNAGRALLAAPLSVGKEAVGVLVVEAPPTAEVSPRLIALLAEAGEILGASIASDVERHKLSQKVVKLSVVNDEGLQLLSLTDRDKVLLTATASTAMILDAEAVVLRIRERRGERLLVGGTYGLHRDDIDEALVRIDQAVAARVSESRVFLRSDRLDAFGVELPAVFPYRTLLAGPLFAGDRLVGTVSAYNKVLYHSFACGAFDHDDQEILEKFSFYVGRALVQAQEFRERQALITIDEVTGLRNRRYLDLRLPEEIRRAERYQRKVSLLIMEVAGFRELSGAFTAQGRDELLRALAGMVRETFRNVDILARLEDSRFAIVMPDTGDAMRDVLDRLLHAVDTFRLRGSDGLALEVKLSVGTCTYPAEAASVQKLLERAAQLRPLE